MSDDSNRTLSRRSVLAGAAGLTIAGASVGAFSSSVAGASSTLSVATNNVRLENDRGDLASLTIDPTFRIEWEDFDDAVGEVFFAIEAKLPDMDEFYPVFRTSPWLIPDGRYGNYDRPASINGWRSGSNPPANYSKPGTTGFVEFNAPVSRVLEASAIARDEEPGPVAERGIVIADEQGRPDYEAAVDGDTLTASQLAGYLSGNTIGSTPEKVENELDIQLQNRDYGAAMNTASFDNGADGTTARQAVQLRYIVQLRRPGVAQMYQNTPNLTYGQFNGTYDGSGDKPEITSYDELETYIREEIAAAADFESGWLENMRPSDVAIVPEIVGSSGGDGDPVEFLAFDATQSLIPMDGTDGYPSMSTEELPPTTRAYDRIVNISDQHPAALASEPQFVVAVRNELSRTKSDGETNAGATGGGQ